VAIFADARDWLVRSLNRAKGILERLVMNSPLEKLKQNPKYNRKLRIALMGTRGVPHTYGGYEAFFLELAPRLVERGHEVIAYNRRSLFKEKPSHYKGVRLIYLPSIETKNLGTMTHMLASVIDVLFRKTDVILCVNVANATHLLLPRLFGKNVSCNVDGLDWLRDKWGPVAKKYFYMNAKIVGKICPKGIVTDAYEMHRIYMDNFNTPSACIAYGANIEAGKNPDAVRRYGLESGQYYLIASRLVPENNADLIVDAFSRLKTDKVLAIAGNANYKSDFVDKLKQNAGPNVKFLGHVGSVDDVKELHCNCYAYVHGHMMGGTNPALVKAMGYGNMVVALNTLFNQEVVQDFGVLFEKNIDDLREKLQYVEDNPLIAAEFRRRAPERIRDAYTWDHITDQYEELFLQLAAGDDATRVHSTVINHPEALARTTQLKLQVRTH
jgi:glycosyltransferase involved in cell wall biosynthesis